MENILNILEESYRTLFDQIAAFIPNVLGALIILLVGWIIAKLIRT